MDLGTLKPSPGSTHRKKRVGRGIGSGNGKTAGRGHKGRRSRSGGNTPPGYEGGQMPLQRRIPKRGFRRLPVNERERKSFEIVNLGSLSVFSAGAAIDPQALMQAGLVHEGSRVKVLAEGSLVGALNIRAHAFSKGAMEKIAAAGGTAELIEAA